MHYPTLLPLRMPSKRLWLSLQMRKACDSWQTYAVGTQQAEQSQREIYSNGSQKAQQQAPLRSPPLNSPGRRVQVPASCHQHGACGKSRPPPCQLNCLLAKPRRFRQTEASNTKALAGTDGAPYCRVLQVSTRTAPGGTPVKL